MKMTTAQVECRHPHFWIANSAVYCTPPCTALENATAAKACIPKISVQEKRHTGKPNCQNFRCAISSATADNAVYCIIGYPSVWYL